MNKKFAIKARSKWMLSAIRINIMGSTKLAILALSVFLFSCQPSDEQRKHDVWSFIFQPYFKQHAINCASDSLKFEDPYQQIWQIQTLALYVSEIKAQFNNNTTWHAFPFLENKWQSASSGLLWFTSNCQQRAKPVQANGQDEQIQIESAHNNQIQLKLAAQITNKYSIHDLSALRFTMAVPFAENHKNPLLQASPLNVPEMFWSWRLGHKFFRMDLVPQSLLAEQSPWSFHLGSLGCESDSSMRAPKSQCLIPNRFSFEVTFNHETAVKDKQANIRLDLAALLDEINVNEAPNCMFSNSSEEVVCKQLRTNLQNKEIFSAGPKQK